MFNSSFGLTKKCNLNRVSAWAIVAILVFAEPPVLAQDVGNDESLEEVVVTGSRIKRSGSDTATAVQVIGQSDIGESGFVNINDVLRSNPTIGVGLSGANNSPGALPNGQAGAGFVNLRGLGTDRSLVLVDGRRRVSGSFTSSAVDVSMIPAGLIERVEIITGGASAVYGADAVSGVVNMVMRDDIDGLELSIGSGFGTEGGGGERASLDLVGGSEFANGRGSMVFGLSYSKEEELTALQRDFSSTNLSLVPNPANTGPNDGIADRIHISNDGFWIFPYSGSFNMGGTWYTIDPGVRPIDLGDPTFGIRGIGAEGFRPVDFNRLRTEQQLLTIRFGAEFDISDQINFFIDADFGQSESLGAGQPDNTTAGGGFAINTIQRDNPLLPADLAALMDANGKTSFGYNAPYRSWGNRTPIFDRTSYTITAGLEGAFSNGWEWEVFAQDAEYEANSRWQNFSITERVANAIDVIADPVSGDPVCRSGAPGCVPFFPLGPDRPAEEALDYFQIDVLRQHKNEQQIASASMTGGFGGLSAGDIQFATGLEYRKETISTQDEELATQGAVHLWRGAQPQDASLSVKEAYLEAVIPILADASMARQLDVELAARFSDYDTIGSTTAAKIGVNWALTDSLRIRTSSATSVRAPNLSELFNPGITGGAFLTDPCDITQINLGTATRPANCAALGILSGWVDPDPAPAKEVVTGGNPELQEEESDSLTFGVVITPTAIEGLSLSFDYWDIEITNAVGSFGVEDIVRKCVDSPTIDNAFCPMVTRDASPGSTIRRIDVATINVGRLDATGIDFAGSYNFDAWKGSVSVTLGGTYLLDHEQLVDANDPTTLVLTKDNPDNPELRANLNLSYIRGAWNFGLNTRYIGSTMMDPNVLTNESIDLNNIPSKVYNDLIIGYEFDNSLRLSATVVNLGDVDPPRRSDNIYLGGRGNYDNFGRLISLRASYNF
jgi:outer membrane receptor protein involved in Fe transport